MVGSSVRDFLCNQMGLKPDFVENQIQTVFLDGKPVDDLDAATVQDKAALALSAAMPGLVGATMRRKGYYASLRGQISHREELSEKTPTEEGMVTLKLFNLVAGQLGRALLEKGILVERENLRDFIKAQPAAFLSSRSRARLNDKETSLEDLWEMHGIGQFILLRVTFVDD
jgi:hypothetical protein